MEEKDLLTLAISAFALIVAFVTFVRKDRVDRITIRSTLTTTVQKLAELNVDVAKYSVMTHEERAKLPPLYPRMVNDQRRLVVRQAAVLAEAIEPLVTPYEYMVIASAFVETDDVSTGEEYYRRALRGRDAIEYCIVARRYAAHLFREGERAIAEYWFEAAVRAVDHDNDRHHSYRGDTYFRWADEERSWGDTTRAVILLDAARREFARIKNPIRQEREVRRTEEALRRLVEEKGD